jgi:hypothetical protein
MRSDVQNGLKVSVNRRYLVDAKTGAPVFLLADTAWNLGALKLEEIDIYLNSRAAHGFNTVMFALNFAPQASENNAYGQPAYIGWEKNTLNPAYFTYCDEIVKKCADRGLYVMMYAMWAGTAAGTMNDYTVPQLYKLGLELGRRYSGVKNVILCAGGESTPPYIDVESVNAVGLGLRGGSGRENLVTVHPVSEHSTSEFFSRASWLDFYMIQGKSSLDASSALFDTAVLVEEDRSAPVAKPTMMVEHRYESGVNDDPWIQRRTLYQCVFAGAFGHAYGHNALWQMTPHTAQPWMLKGWNPGVKHWTQALDTPAVSQLKYIKTLLYSLPYFDRMPDQTLVVSGQGSDVASRVQVTRDGSAGHDDASYVIAYLSSPQAVTLRTSVIGAPRLTAHWIDPVTGVAELIARDFANPGELKLEKRTRGKDWIMLVEDAVYAVAR